MTRLVQAYAGRAFSDVRCHHDRLDQPFRWRKPRKVFVNSMSDLFHPDVPDAFIHAVFTTMAKTPQHVFQVLTKRPERMRELLHLWVELGLTLREGCGAVLPNVWLGVSVENQAAADERIPLLLDTPAAVRWISAEPLLGPVDLKRWMPTGKWGSFKGNPVYQQTYFMTKCERCGWLGSSELVHEVRYGDDADCACPDCNEIFMCDDFGDGRGVHWVVVGGESGPNARPMHPDWARSLRDQCAAAGVPFLFKQWGEWSEWGTSRPSTWLRIDGTTADQYTAARDGQAWIGMHRVGKKRAGRLLDGVTHDGYPESQP